MLYVVDNYANTVVQVAPAGGTNWQVTAIAGAADSAGCTTETIRTQRFSEPGGIAIDSSNNLYVADTGNNTLRKITRSLEQLGGDHHCRNRGGLWRRRGWHQRRGAVQCIRPALR